MNDIFPQPESPNKQSHNVMSIVILFSAKELSYGDITGSFPFKSSRGNQYTYVLYDYNASCILAEPMKTRQAQEISVTWEKLHTRLMYHGHQVSHFFLDNECSEDLKQSFNGEISKTSPHPTAHLVRRCLVVGFILFLFSFLLFIFKST